MSGCADVCMDLDYGIENEFYAEEERRAKAEHECIECGRTITRGETYQRAIGKCEGDWFTAKTCADCHAIRDALVCGGFLFGSLWDDIAEYVYPKWVRVSPMECLAKIESKAARDKLSAGFDEWFAEACQ